MLAIWGGPAWPPRTMQGLLLADTPADPSSTTSWAAIVLAILTIIYIVAIRPMKKKRDRDPLARQPNTTLLSQQRAIERDMTALLVEYEQMMRTMTAQIDMRTTKLELLIREADEKIAALKLAGQRAGVKPVQAAAAAALVEIKATGDVEAPIRAPIAALPAPNTVEAAPAAVESPAIAPAAHAERLNQEASELKEAAAVLHAPADPPDPHAEIYALADRGLTYRQIAHQLDRAYGEIELILALRPRIAAAAPKPTDESQDAPSIADDESSSAAHPTRIHARANPRNKHRRKQPN